MFPENTYFPAYTRTAIIYIGCIVCCFIALGAMPYLKTDVSVRSSALIRPASEVNIIPSACVCAEIPEAILCEETRQYGSCNQSLQLKCNYPTWVSPPVSFM